jgi:SAM-dependent methyltransferase
VPLAELVTQGRRIARRELLAARARVRPDPAVGRYLAEHRGRARLNVGSGGALLDGWLNADRDPAPGAIHVDATHRFALPDAAFDHVLVEHVIEHVRLGAGRAMLRECARVLRPGGRIRVSTPDLGRLAGLVTSPALDPGAERYAQWVLASFVPDAVGSPGALVLNHNIRAWEHRFLFDAATLARALRDAGFAEVVRRTYRESDDPAFAGVEGSGIDATGIEMRTWETLGLEATRPGA